MSPSEPRKSSRLWIILGIVAVLLVVFGGAAAFFGGKVVGQFLEANRQRREQRTAKMNALETQGREMQQAAKDALENGGAPEGMADRLNRFGKTVGDAAESTSGMEKKGLVAAQRVLQSVAPALAKYETAAKQLKDSGVVNASNIDSREAIAAHVAIVKNLGEANDGLRRVFDGLEGNVRAELEKEGVSPAYRDQFVKGFLRSANVDLNRTIRDCDTELVAVLLKMLAILDRDWGKWKAEGINFRFEKTATADEYNALAESLQDIATRQSVAQQELLNRARTSPPIR